MHVMLNTFASAPLFLSGKEYSVEAFDKKEMRFLARNESGNKVWTPFKGFIVTQTDTEDKAKELGELFSAMLKSCKVGTVFCTEELIKEEMENHFCSLVESPLNCGLVWSKDGGYTIELSWYDNKIVHAAILNVLGKEGRRWQYLDPAPKFNFFPEDTDPGRSIVITY